MGPISLCPADYKGVLVLISASALFFQYRHIGYRQTFLASISYIWNPLVWTVFGKERDMETKGVPIWHFCRYADTPILVIADMSILPIFSYERISYVTDWIYSLFTIFAEWFLANIFTTRCHSLMGVSPLDIGSQLWHLPAAKFHNSVLSSFKANCRKRFRKISEPTVVSYMWKAFPITVWKYWQYRHIGNHQYRQTLPHLYAEATV